MTFWLVEGPTPEGRRRIALSGNRVCHHTAEIRDPVCVPIGAGPPDHVPAAILPSDTTRVADLAQVNPPDKISGWVRLWLLGLLETRPGWDGVVCATYGQNTHWVEISADEIVSSRSALTRQLSQVMHGEEAIDTEALAASISRPERLASDLYVAQLKNQGAAVTSHLLGAELAAMRAYWLGRDVVVIGDHEATYATALKSQGAPVTVSDSEALLRAGLAAFARATGREEMC